MRPCRDYSKPTRTQTRTQSGRVVWTTVYPEMERDQRYPFYLRCVQGHSDGVRPGGISLTPSASVYLLSTATIPSMIFHCTPIENVLPILAEGMLRGRGVKGQRALHFMILHPRDVHSKYAGREGAEIVLHVDGKVICECMR